MSIYIAKTFCVRWVQNAGTHSFSIGVTEVLNTNLVIELRADDVEYVYQRLVICIQILDVSSSCTEVSYPSRH